MSTTPATGHAGTEYRELVSETSWFDGLDQPRRYWPVAIESTETRIILIEADSHEDAVRQAKDDSELYERWNDADRTDWADLGVPAGHSQSGPVDSWRMDRGKAGPREACTCGAVARGVEAWALRYADHAGDCPHHIHHVSLSAAWGVGEDKGIVGWRPGCSCGAPGLDRALGRGDEFDPRPHFAKDVAQEMARVHAIDKPHSVNKPLGLPGREVDVRRVETVTVGSGVL